MTQPDFIMIPTQLLSDETLQPSDRILFGYIYWMTKLALMRCVASNETLSELTGFSERNIKMSLDRLEQQGYVGRIYKGEGKRNRLEITCTIAFSALNPQIEGTNVHSRGNKRALVEGTGVPHNKKREEEHLKRNNKVTKKQISLSSDDYPELKPELEAFIDHRKALKKPLTPSSLKLLIGKLKEWYPSNPDSQRQCLEQSIINGWQGVFQLKGEPNTKPKSDLNVGQLLHPEKYGNPSGYAAMLAQKMDVRGQVSPS